MRFSIPARRAARYLAGMPHSYNFTATLHLRGAMTLEQLQSALNRLCQRHPLLAARVLMTDDGQAFLTDEGASPVPVRILPRTSESTWVESLDQELLIKPNYQTGPLFHCCWVRGAELSDLILVSDHATADGRSLVFALRDLLALLAEPQLELEPILPIRMAQALTPLYRQKVAEMEASVPPGAPPAAPWNPNLAADPRNITPFELTADETTKLIARCRAEGVTVQAALSAAFLTPYAERNPENTLRTAEVPIDLRPYLQQPTQDWYGVFLALAVIKVDCRPEKSLWETARNAHAALKAVDIETLFFTPPAVFQIADKVPPVKMFDAEYDVSISNLGRFELADRYGPLEVLGVHAPIFNVIMASHRVFGVATCNGQLTAASTSRDPAAPALAQRGWELLRAMIKG